MRRRRPVPSVRLLPPAVIQETAARLAALPPIADGMMGYHLQMHHRDPLNPIPLYCIAYLCHQGGYEPYAQALRDFVIDEYPHLTGSQVYERAKERIRRGEWKGWEELEARWQDEGYISSMNRTFLISEPWWDGKEDISDKRILIFGEGGFGDMLMMARYLPLVMARADEVMILVPEELRVLFESAYEFCAIRDGKGNPLRVVTPTDQWPTYDRVLPSMSLPAIFGPQPPDRYLLTSTGAHKAHERRFANDPVNRVGVCWRGRRQPDPLRSMPSEAIVPLMGPRSLVALQPEIPIHDQGHLDDLCRARGWRWVMAYPKLTNFADTAKLIVSCGAVVTIDSAIAHLAGCLGVKTYLCLPYWGCFRWGSQLSSTTDWYPSMAIVRQEKPGEWASVVERVAEMLAG